MPTQENTPPSLAKTITWYTTLVISNFISTPFAIFLFQNLVEALNKLLDEYDGGDRPEWLPIIYIYFGIGVACSTIIDTSNQNLKDFTLDHNKDQNYHTSYPRAVVLLYRINQIIFTLNAVIYSMPYAIGASILTSSEEGEIAITVPALFFGTIYYLTFTDDRTWQHAKGIFNLKGILKDAKRSPLCALRAAEFCTMQAIYRAILAANDIIQFWLKMKICKKYDGDAALPIVIIILVLTFYITPMTRNASIWNNYVLPPLLPDYKTSLGMTPYIGTYSILPLIQCMAESGAIGYMCFNYLHPAAILLAFIYFIYSSYTELSLARVHKAIRDCPPQHSINPNDSTYLINNDNGFDDAVKTILDEYNISTAKVIVFLGRLTRPQVLFNFIKIVMAAFTSYSMGFTIPTDIILAIVIFGGSKFFTSEYFFYIKSFRKVIAERWLTEKLLQNKSPERSWMLNKLYRIFIDWTPKGDYTRAEVELALSQLRKN